MQTKSLYIIAAGLSSRMNGVPKHLCKIQGVSNLEHTLKLSFGYFDNIFVVVNENLDDVFLKQTEDICFQFNNVTPIKIESGKGDLHAINNALKLINDYESDIYCIWGDTYFYDNSIFSKMLYQEKMLNNQLIGVFCAKEINPYAYINVYKDTNVITESGFFIEESNSVLAYHDQSAFRINGKLFNNYYQKYATSFLDELNNLEKTYKLKKVEYEYSIIKFINWCAKNSTINNVVYDINEPITQSYNTFEELNNIIICD